MDPVPVSELSEYIGQETGTSDWIAIDQARIDSFADTTLDHQWIHVDPQQAASGPFGTTIAHGFLTLSLVSHLSSTTALTPEGAGMLINYGSDKVRFLSPVRVGSRIRAVSTFKAVKERAPGQILMTSTVVVEIEGEETPALVADVLTLAFITPQA